MDDTLWNLGDVRMREILFKAKRIDNGEWVEGFLFKMQMDGGYTWCIGKEPLTANDYSEIIGCGRAWLFINYHTLCQYTGLTDKNGNKIWENDVVSYYDDLANINKEDLVKWSETHASFVRLHESKMGLQYLYIDECIANRCEVIGNTFDNADLLKGEYHEVPTMEEELQEETRLQSAVGSR